MSKFILITTFFILSLLKAQTLQDNIPLTFPVLNTMIDPKSLASIKLIEEPIVVKIKAGQYSGLILSPTLYNQSKNEQQPLLPLVGFNPNYKIEGLPSWGSFSVANNTISLNPPESFNERIHAQIFFSDPKNNSANLSITFQPYFSNLGAQKFSLIANSSFDRKPGVWTLAYPIYVSSQQNLNNAHHVLDKAFMIDQAISPWTTLTNLITPQQFLFLQNNVKQATNVPHSIDQQTSILNPFDNTNNLTIVNTTTVTVTNPSHPFSNQIIIPQTDYNNSNNFNFNQNNFTPLINNISQQQNISTSVPLSGLQTINTTSTTVYFPTNNYQGGINGGFPLINNNLSPTNSLPLNTTQVINTSPIFNYTIPNTTTQSSPKNPDESYNYVPLIFGQNSSVPAIDTIIKSNATIQTQPKQTSAFQNINTQPIVNIPSEKQNKNSSSDLQINNFENTQPISVLPIPSTVNVSIQPNNQLNTSITPQINTSIINPVISTVETTPIVQITSTPQIQNTPQFNISDITVSSPIPQPSQIINQNQDSITQPIQSIAITNLTNTTNKLQSNQNSQVIPIPQIITPTVQLTPALVNEQNITQKQSTTLPGQILPIKNELFNQTSFVPLPLPQISKFSQFDLSALGIDMSALNTTPPITSNIKPVQLVLPNITTPAHIGLDTNHDIATPITMSFPDPSYVAPPKVSPIQIQDFSNLLNQTANNVQKPAKAKFIDLTNNAAITVNNATQKISDIVETTPKKQ